MDAEGALAGAALLSRSPVQHEVRDELRVWIAPEHRRRGLGLRLVRWAESEAQSRGGEDDRTHVLRIDRCTTTLTPDPDTEAWLERAGFEFRFAECELRRDLELLPTLPSLPPELRAVGWSEESAGQFFQAYSAAFRERPGFPGWPEPVWREAFTGSPEFSPELSTVLADGNTGAAFSLCHLEPEGIGWVVQMGVVPAWRLHGLGIWLLAAALHGFRERGMREAALDVNLNNPGALALYQRLGFQVRNCRRVYQKPLG